MEKTPPKEGGVPEGGRKFMLMVVEKHTLNGGEDYPKNGAVIVGMVVTPLEDKCEFHILEKSGAGGKEGGPRR